MFIEIRKRGKTKKYYFVHSYRENEKVRRISRYLGSDLSEKKLLELKEKAEQHILEEIKERSILEFELTEKEIDEYKKYESNIGIKHLQTLDWKRFTEYFTYNTNVIEGSTVALSEVKELLSGKEEPQDANDVETLNVAKAVKFISNTEEKITVDFFKHLHLICFKGTKKFAGKLRDVNVIIRDSNGNIIYQGAPIDKVKGLLEELCKWYEKHKNKYSPLLLAAVMHNQFEKIHPFQDGNGRVGRLLLNYVLLQHKYPPINIRLQDRGRYYKCLQEYDKKNDIKSTLKFLISQYKKQF
ncbi:Fic family protein [Candidatus Woesearchaeota archaeon]|nr:Fic family protein [Candidatus Woesearchaeota archaeon]